MRDRRAKMRQEEEDEENKLSTSRRMWRPVVLKPFDCGGCPECDARRQEEEEEELGALEEEEKN